VRGAAIAAAILVLLGVLVVFAGTSAVPISRTCAEGMDVTGCEEAVTAVMKRGLPALHPLILGAHVEPGSAPGPQDLGHRATVTFELLGVPGPTSIDLYFDRGAHWGGESDRGDTEIKAWALAPLVIVSLLVVALLGLAWRRRSTATE
jgi:hypothetical protein